jgi:hypothetical protein
VSKEEPIAAITLEEEEDTDLLVYYMSDRTTYIFNRRKDF